MCRVCVRLWSQRKTHTHTHTPCLREYIHKHMLYTYAYTYTDIQLELFRMHMSCLPGLCNVSLIAPFPTGRLEKPTPSLIY